jgi:Family of unknown function (DUF6232)
MPTAGVAPTKEETIFYFDNGGVRVTSSRLIIGPTTYPMLNITSVLRAEERPSRVGPLIVLIIGGLCLLNGLAGPEHGAAVFGVFILVGDILWWKGQKIKYHLGISSASSEANAVTDFDKQRIDNIIQGVNEATIRKG